MSDYLEEELVKHILRTGTFTKPSVLAIALLTTAAIDADTGQFSTGTGVEVVNTDTYEREARNPLDANWTAVAAGDVQSDNAAVVTYVTATAAWGTVSAMAITDSATFDAGNMLFRTPVGTNRTISSGDTAEFAIGAITITFG